MVNTEIRLIIFFAAKVEKLYTSTGSYKKQENSRKIPTFASLTMEKPLTVWFTANWKILQEMEISVTCLLVNLYVDQEATVTTGHGTTGSKLGKAIYYHPAYLTSIQSTSCEMPGLMKHSWNQDCREKYQSPQICR